MASLPTLDRRLATIPLTRNAGKIRIVPQVTRAAASVAVARVARSDAVWGQGSSHRSIERQLFPRTEAAGGHRHEH
jgi:hypothetical protein